MFGELSIIEKIENRRPQSKNAIDRIYFSGQIFTHHDPEINYTRDRKQIYSELRHFIYNPGFSNYERYLDMMNTSKFCLDLNGVGDPNKRTFEILSQHSLRIGEYNDLVYPFDDIPFRPETIFTNKDDFIDKLSKLQNNHELYEECLEYQHRIYEKYFNLEWIRNYICSFMDSFMVKNHNLE
jgi:hypothetical protein